METTKIVIADDDTTTLVLLKMFCRDVEGIELRFAANGQEALDLIGEGRGDILITDLRMPILSGAELLTTVKRSHPHIPVLIMTGYGTIESAVEYLQRGADDYLPKPLTKDVFLHRLQRVSERIRLKREVARLKDLQQSPVDSLVGRSPTMIALKGQVPTLAQTEASIVIYGESGTGKEVVASALHALSRRAKQPFVTVNCGALPENLLEAELFGYRRGAFTDARADNPGLVDSANGGTLFLDEIGEISLGVQVKLLRFLQQKEYKAVGSPDKRIADVRIIAATNRDLVQAVRDKTFREDLYYRLNVVPIQLPPLRERPGDITMLALSFLERFNQRFNKSITFSPSLLQRLETYSWPGNIRELENKVEQLVVMTHGGEVDAEQVELGIAATKPLRETPCKNSLGTFKEEKAALLQRFERDYLSSILEVTGGHMTQAAKQSGMDRKNLWQLMKRHGLKAESFKR